ncbi:hypothetical protein, partial [Acinetobacter sp. V2]
FVGLVQAVKDMKAAIQVAG